MKNRIKNLFINNGRDDSKTLRSCASKIDRWLNEHTMLCIAIAVFIMVGLIVISLFLPDNGHKIVKSELEKSGYTVENIDFTLVEKDGFGSTGKRIYQASEPIEYKEDIMVDQWELKSYLIGNIMSYHSVKPYPEIPSTIPVNLYLTITQEDYNLLNEQAGEQGVEEYIKQLIYESTRAEQQ